MDSQQQKELKKRLKVLMNLPENQTCADCPERQPRWASLIVPPPGAPDGTSTLGAFMCLECSGSHRRLGVHIAFVRSINLDSWKEKEVLAMENGGNAKVNAVFEAHLAQSGVQKPSNHADGPTRERYVRDKYERRKFYDADAFRTFSSTTVPSLSSRRTSNNSQLGPPSDAARQRMNSRQQQQQQQQSHHRSLQKSNSTVAVADTAGSSASSVSAAAHRPNPSGIAPAPASAPVPNLDLLDLFASSNSEPPPSRESTVKTAPNSSNLSSLATATITTTATSTATIQSSASEDILSLYSNGGSSQQHLPASFRGTAPCSPASTSSPSSFLLSNTNTHSGYDWGSITSMKGGIPLNISSSNSIHSGSSMSSHGNNNMNGSRSFSQPPSLGIQHQQQLKQHLFTPQQMMQYQQMLMIKQQQQQQQQQMLLMQQQQQQKPQQSQHGNGGFGGHSSMSSTSWGGADGGEPFGFSSHHSSSTTSLSSNGKPPPPPEKEDPFAQFSVNAYQFK